MGWCGSYVKIDPFCCIGVLYCNWEKQIGINLEISYLLQRKEK